MRLLGRGCFIILDLIFYLIIIKLFNIIITKLLQLLFLIQRQMLTLRLILFRTVAVFDSRFSRNERLQKWSTNLTALQPWVRSNQCNGALSVWKSTSVNRTSLLGKMSQRPNDSMIGRIRNVLLKQITILRLTRV